LDFIPVNALTTTRHQAFGEGVYKYDYFGTTVNVIALACADGTAIFYEVAQYCVSRWTDLLVMLSRHFSGDYDVCYNAPSDMLGAWGMGGGDKIVSHTVDGLSSLPDERISAEHHVHYKPTEVWDALTDTPDHVKRLALCAPPDAHSAFMAGFILWLSELSDSALEVARGMGLFCAPNRAVWAKRAKALSVKAKSWQNLWWHDLRPLFEVDVLVNRLMQEVDWQAEKTHRTAPNIAKLSYEDVYSRARRMLSCSSRHSAMPRKHSWRDFWRSRWQWSASGAIHSQHDIDANYVSKERALKNKFITLCAYPSVDSSHFTKRQPAIHVWTSTKYEWGKVRALYAGDLTSYVIAHFAMQNCEDTLPTRFPVGAAARPDRVRSAVEVTLKDRLPFCLDYEDFNSQHSVSSMQAAIMAWGDHHRHNISDEQYAAVQWTAQSVANQTVHDFSGTHSEYDAKGTLMSGWRLTSFVNSLLNGVYSQYLLEGDDFTYRSIHNGDDVLAGVYSLETLRRASARARDANIRMQPVKCNFGGMAEFLRVDHVHGGTGQYLTRGIATLVHGRIESKRAVQLPDLVEANEERLQEFVIRGGDEVVAARLRQQYYSHIGRAYDAHEDDCWAIKEGHRCVGGISERADSRIDRNIMLESVPATVLIDMALPAVREYAEEVATTLGLEDKTSKITKRLMDSTLDAVQLVRKTVKVLPNIATERSRVFKGIWKSYHKMAQMPVFGKAKMVGFALEVAGRRSELAPLSNYLRACKDPWLTLQIVC
jgi:hypothetical protein